MLIDGGENSPDDGDFQNGCTWAFSLQSRFRAFFITPVPKPKGPPSLIDITARFIAQDIVQEGVPNGFDEPENVHPLLAHLPEHLRRVVEATVFKELAKSEALKQREYCVNSLKTVEGYLAFNPITANVRGARPHYLDRRVKDPHLGEDSGTDRRFMYFPTEEIFLGWEEFPTGTYRLGAEFGRELINVTEGLDASVNRPDWYVENVCLLRNHLN